MAAGGNILVTPEQLATLGSQLNTGASTIEQTLSQLQGQVQQVEWRGHAKGQFEALWQEWQRSAAGIQHALHGISRLTTTAGATYADTEQAIGSSFSG